MNNSEKLEFPTIEFTKVTFLSGAETGTSCVDPEVPEGMDPKDIEGIDLKVARY